MKGRSRLIFAFVLLMSMIAPLTGVSAASASSTAENVRALSGLSADEAAAYWQSLSLSEQEAVTVAMTNFDVSWELIADEEVSSFGANGAMASGCGTKTAVGTYGSFGVTQFKLYSATYWCWNGSTVSNGSSGGTWATVHSTGWQYVTGGGYPWMRIENWGSAIYKHAQAYFKLCYAACVQHVYPYIKSYGEEDGSLGWDQSGW